MTSFNRKQIRLYEESQAGLNSLVKQTAQVGAGLLGILLLTGGNPPALTVGLSVIGGIAFVAWSEEKRLTKFYARQARLQQDIEIASETKQPQIPNSRESESLKSIENESELPELTLKERLRQSRYSFNAALATAVLSSCFSIIGVVLLLSGKVPEGAVATSSGMAASLSSLRLSKDAKDRLDRITKKLKEDSD